MPRKAKKKPVSVRAQVRYEKRRIAVQALSKGELASDVARVMKIPRRTLFTWIARYRHGGEHALQDRQKSGQPRKAEAKVLHWLYDAITLGYPRQYQLPYCLWTLAIVRRLLKKEHGVEMSKSGVSRMLKHLGLSPQRPIYRSYKRDPEEMKKYLDKTFPGLRAKARRMGPRFTLSMRRRSGRTLIAERPGARSGRRRRPTTVATASASGSSAQSARVGT